MATQVDPDLRIDVDFMILDYLACLAIERILVAAESSSPSPEVEEEVNWMVDPIRALQFVMATAHPDTPLPLDLDIKIRILTIIHQLWNYRGPHTTTAAATMSANRINATSSPELSTIGLNFMEMCAVAESKVSETRWFDTGAQFMVQTSLEEHDKGRARDGPRPWFDVWDPTGPERMAKWSRVHDRYAAEIPDPKDDAADWERLRQKYPFWEFKMSVVAFLFELMMTLDPPVLVQLERGKLGNLTVDETRQLKERVGMR